jgi:hypothetical protein
MLHTQGVYVFANARVISMIHQKLLQSLAGVRKQSPHNEIDRSGCAFDVQKDGLNRASAGGRCQR